MNVSIKFAFTLMFIPLNLKTIRSTRLTVVTSEPLEFLLNHHQQISNEDPPSESDKATNDPFVRNQICENIYKSGVFKLNYDPVYLNEYQAEQKRSTEYSDILSSDEISGLLRQSDPYRCATPYKLRQLQFIGSIIDGLGMREVRLDINEYTFPCFLRDKNSNKIVKYYISKSYNPPHDRRFLFLKTAPYYSYQYTRILLSEKSSEVYTKSGFNIELHYLELKKHHNLAETLELDPVCKLNSGELNDDQSFRLCAIVSGSTYFKDKIIYPRRSFFNAWVCYKHKISFRTTEALEIAAGKFYQERMIRCYVTLVDGSDHFFYMSRAYNPHQVFVYSVINGNIYLDVMSIDVSNVHELYHFDEVEI